MDQRQGLKASLRMSYDRVAQLGEDSNCLARRSIEYHQLLTLGKTGRADILLEHK